MRVLDLFAGIGGFSLAAHWMGWKTVAFVERDKACQKVLAKRFEGVPIYEDVRDVSGESFRGIVDIVTAGFPCPAFSRAGKRGGFEQDDLFFEAIRVATESECRWIVFENVEGIRPWIPEVRATIQTAGYEFTDAIFDGTDFGVAQLRRRYFAVCFRRGNGTDSQPVRRIQRNESAGIHGLQPYAPNAERRWTPTIKTKDEWRTICSDAVRVRDLNGIPGRMDRLKQLGNSINPQLAFEIFKAIEAAN